MKMITKCHFHCLLAMLTLYIPTTVFAQPADLPWDPDPDCNSIVTTGIVVASCGILDNLPDDMRYSMGLLDFNEALPAIGRVDVTAQQDMYHHPSWHVDSIGNIFGLTIDHCGNVYAAASSNYASQFFFFNSIVRYGDIGGGPEDLEAAGTIYKIDKETAQASQWAVLPQQSYSFTHETCEGFLSIPRTTGPGLGNMTFNQETKSLYASNFEDGRIYRLDTMGNILESYDPFDIDSGFPGPPQDIYEIPYALAVNNEGTELFFGTMGGNGFGTTEAGIYSIPINADGSFAGTVDNTNMPAGATWDNLVGDEQLHTFIDNYTTNFISGMEFTPDDKLLIGNRVGCNNSIQTSYNHGGLTLLFSMDVSGLYTILDGNIVSSTDSFGATNAYGGVSVFETPAGEVQYIISNGDVLGESGPHGVVVSPENVFGAFNNPASPQGVISYVPPAFAGDAKGMGGDVVIFKSCNCAPVCPDDLITEPLAVCSNEPFSLNYEVLNGNIQPNIAWTDEDGNPVPNPNNVTIEHVDCAPGEYLFFLNATCETDQTINYLDTLVVTVVTDDLTPFFTTVEEDCLIDLLIDPNCVDFISINGTIPDIMIGDSGTVQVDLLQTTDLICTQQSVFLSFNCQCFYEDFSFEQEACELGQYYITLDFRPEGADEFFTLTDQNGNNYGTFSYAELPIQIGPFDGDAVSEYTLFVQDDNFTDCTASFSFGSLYCPPGQGEWLSTSPSCLQEFGSLEAVNVVGGAAPYQYSIDGGETFSESPFFTNLAPGTYDLVIQDAFGETLESSEVIVPLEDVTIFVAEPETSILLGNNYELEVQTNLLPSQIDTIIWSPASGLSCTDCLNPVALPLETTEYTVQITDIFGCIVEARVLLPVDRTPAIYIPNAFSPDGDGVNEVFMIFARDESVEQIQRFLVFSRWGELVYEYENFQPNNPAYGWDGFFQGKLMNPAVFAWFAVVEFIDGREVLFKGDVTLVR